MTGTRSKGAIALALLLAAFLLADLYKAEFGAPQNEPIPVTTPTETTLQPTFTQTQIGVTVTTPADAQAPAYGYQPPATGVPTGYPSSPAVP
jgi:hypothetical protein